MSVELTKYLSTNAKLFAFIDLRIKMKPQIIPAILANDKKDLRKKITVSSSFGLVQIDICDGKFVKSRTVQPVDFTSVSPHSRLEFHLMVNDVDHYVEHFLHLNPEIIIFHFEACKNDARVLHLIRHIKSHNIKVGLAINPETNSSHIKKFVKIVDKILVMTVHPGKQGQRFIKTMLPKIKALRKLDKNLNIEADGGINETTILLAKKAGANLFVVGSAIFNSKNPVDAFKKMKKIVE